MLILIGGRYHQNLTLYVQLRSIALVHLANLFINQHKQQSVEVTQGDIERTLSSISGENGNYSHVLSIVSADSGKH